MHEPLRKVYSDEKANPVAYSKQSVHQTILNEKIPQDGNIAYTDPLPLRLLSTIRITLMFRHKREPFIHLTQKHF